MKAFWFVALYYLKYFCVITAGLGLFFVGIDVLKLASELPDSANLLILFILYDFAYALGFILPISILLSEVMVLSVLLRNNEFAALLSLGHSKRQIGLPIFICAALLLSAFVALNATPFAYSKEEVDRIINKNFTNRS
ncbi:MAG: LptF/LptG family permease, partial [Helicobacter sp.]|nr:LptF/LptG family permease [Helicobacter sp.]